MPGLCFEDVRQCIRAEIWLNWSVLTSLQPCKQVKPGFTTTSRSPKVKLVQIKFKLLKFFKNLEIFQTS